MCLVVHHLHTLNDIRGVNDEDFNVFAVEWHAYETSVHPYPPLVTAMFGPITDLA